MCLKLAQASILETGADFLQGFKVAKHTSYFSMDRDQYERLISSVEGWNQWRRDNPDIEIDLRGANLRKKDMEEEDLRGADLSVAYLTKANLSWADLKGANLKRAYLMRANLKGADLSVASLTKANLTRANLTRADLRRANLIEANLTGADLTGANLTEANLTEANLAGVIYSDDTQWPAGFMPPENAILRPNPSLLPSDDNGGGTSSQQAASIKQSFSANRSGLHTTVGALEYLKSQSNQPDLRDLIDTIIADIIQLDSIIEVQQNKIAKLESENADLKQALAQAQSEVVKGARIAEGKVTKLRGKFVDAAVDSAGKKAGSIAVLGTIGLAVYAGGESLAPILEHLQNILSSMTE